MLEAPWRILEKLFFASNDPQLVFALPNVKHFFFIADSVAE
jgi:hypothetical protein